VTTPPADAPGTPAVSTTPSTSATAQSTGTAVASTTPAAAAAATPAGQPSDDSSLGQLGSDLQELEADLGDRLSDNTKAEIARVRHDLTELVDLANGIEDGSVQGGSH